MCGIAGLIHKGKNNDKNNDKNNGKDGGKNAKIGEQMTSMLLALKHRGPDSTGLALYGASNGSGDSSEHYVMRIKLAEQEDTLHGFRITQEIAERKDKVDGRLAELGASAVRGEKVREYAYRYTFNFSGDLRRLANFIEDVEGAEILSLGHSLELIKDLGDASDIADQYSLSDFRGTHAIGHTRMATESDVDIRSAHPYWAYPFADISVVHNGQLTNYWNSRREMERRGHRFMSNCDSELIAVYIADRIAAGEGLQNAMERSIEAFDGVFTYLVATSDSLGMAKDTMAAKPMVLYESDDFIALASEEVAIRSIFPHEIDTIDPYEGEVRVWQH